MKKQFEKLMQKNRVEMLKAREKWKYLLTGMSEEPFTFLQNFQFNFIINHNDVDMKINNEIIILFSYFLHN